MQDEEKTITRILNIFMTGALVGSLMILFYAVVIMEESNKSLVISGLVGVLTCGLVLWLLHIHQFAIPRLLLPGVTYLLATYLIFTGATVSVRDDAVLLYSLVVALAGLLLRKRGVIVFGILSVVTVELSVYGVIVGFIGDPLSANTIDYSTLITVGVIYVLTFSMMYILVDILTNNVAQARSSQASLSAANQELLSVRESLEQQVRDRTLAAEIDRAAAEVARSEAEAQAWFTRGQAQLAEHMRGDLDLVTLANNITGHLSKYIGAHAGALFVVSGDQIKLAGRYAYVESSDQMREFRLGEGLIGEAAASMQIFLVDDIPANIAPVSSALGQAIPRQLLIVPLESNGSVLGVLEFATLTRFKPEHETFLKRVSESVAIALRTEQTRMKMSDLLEQFKKQAEELQKPIEK
jgi:putative methionine-R-sulfoxide reductase with GAF domain